MFGMLGIFAAVTAVLPICGCAKLTWVWKFGFFG
jgi:hypothetical protein